MGTLTSSAPALADGVSPFIDYLISRYHDVHRAELAALCPLARLVEQRYADHPDCPKGLADYLERFTAILGCHMRREEMILFPMMLRGGNPRIALPVMGMMDEHDEHHAALEGLGRHARGFVAPKDAGEDWRRFYAGVAKVAEDLDRHIYLEDQVLFREFL